MNNKQNFKGLFSYLLLSPLLILISILAVFISILDRGFDITDESFYILCASFSAYIDVVASKYYYYTGIGLDLSNGSVFGFRLFGLILLLLIAAYFARSLDLVVDKFLNIKSSFQERTCRISLLTSGALVYYYYWLPTPSYNWFNLCALLIAYSGLMQAILPQSCNIIKKIEIKSYVFGALLLGTGGFFAFIAKPTTAALLIPVTVLWVFFTELRFKWVSFLSLSALTSLLLIIVHVLLFEKSFSDYIYSYQSTMTFMETLKGEQNIARLFSGAFGEIRKLPGLIWITLRYFMIYIVIISPAFFFLNRKKQLIKTEIFIVLSITVAFFCIWERGLFAGGRPAGFNLGIGANSLIASALIIFATYYWLTHTSLREQILVNTKKLAPLIFLLYMGGYIYAFGSSNPLIGQSANAYIFYLASALLVFRLIDRNFRIPVASAAYSIFASLLIAYILYGATQLPYRLITSLDGQNKVVSLGKSNYKMRVDQTTYNYITGLRNLAKSGGFSRGGYLIDLTGGSPGAAFILEAKPPGVPWLIGGYRGSNNYVFKRLGNVPLKVLEEAWVLTAAKGKRRLSPKVLTSFGIKFPEEYDSLGQVKTAHRNEVQTLWRPLRTMEKNKE